MGTFLAAAGGDQRLARELYVWDRDLAAAMLADIAIVEVALRNAMHDALAAVWGPLWFADPAVRLDERSAGQLASAWKSLPSNHRGDRSDPQLPGRLVARCMLGFWVNLLDAGDHVGAHPRRMRVDYERLWRQALHRAFRGGRAEARARGDRYTRDWAHAIAKNVNTLRNRAAHHEPLVNGFPLPGQNRRLTAEQGHAEVMTLARMLDRDLATWINQDTAVHRLLATRPAP
ncbi:MAG: hypothetical protein QM679_08370 [Patulibacter sp.]